MEVINPKFDGANVVSSRAEKIVAALRSTLRGCKTMEIPTIVFWTRGVALQEIEEYVPHAGFDVQFVHGDDGPTAVFTRLEIERTHPQKPAAIQLGLDRHFQKSDKKLCTVYFMELFAILESSE